MTLTAIKDWIKALIGDIGDGIACGAIDAGKGRFIGVYDKTAGSDAPVAQVTTYNRKRIVLLIHWGQDPTVCAEKASAVRDLIAQPKRFDIDGYSTFVETIKPPIPIGKDNKGIYEYTIEFTLIYNRKD